MASYQTGSEAFARENKARSAGLQGAWADKYRGATVEDLDPPPALSVSPNDSIAAAMMTAYERDYTHLTVIDATKRSLLGYLSIPRLKELLQHGTVKDTDTVAVAMQRFNRKRGIYQVITMETPLEELEQFFESESGPNGEKREKQQFAVVTDVTRKFVLGVATKSDLEEFVKRRPA
ncbi:hypothetical protein POX_g08713 [Penicillium oxalicum]|uniref:CBS domain-containing protein n=1 Tax=Penicillium oxalicum (strain 114-2 / CGMCC 5302) TaxID=933388 RepID=S7Z8S0_PENO1|nr:hypothetical protein POX_g08713 [Penicillium oxalicum]EPS26990.1 hypothetical protein PDE_01931 [Penicillium oxalicum 114-2]KAI2786329.1 hypothetical protein POX_g08713 [Penicillium oxalicum]